jgi:hypothetical protein
MRKADAIIGFGLIAMMILEIIVADSTFARGMTQRTKINSNIFFETARINER